MHKIEVHVVQTSLPTRAIPGRNSPNSPMNSDLNPMSPQPPMNPNMNLPIGPPQPGHRDRTHATKPKHHESPLHRGTPSQMSSTPKKLMNTHRHSVSSTHSPAPSTPAASCPPSQSASMACTVLTTDPPSPH
ncbi:hypothetical protein ATANTOWER_021497 [Ataeniobius toweri]|uniref:Uncharacterized protein n=1 Tax=Ataeniobius toweri TaxID=208326 RepID=A0ABU7CC45_9TELE|nr:hypothetical protein [Ataeniobius toweri]